MTGRPRELLADKFWRKVVKGKTVDDCWKWNASKFRSGYGQITHGELVGERKNLKSHRVSYELHFGKIPDGMAVCHTCDNPECSNPKHLFIGSFKDNAHDMIRKGRRYDTSGENNGQAKITAKIAAKIRSDYSKNDPESGRHVRKKYSQAALGRKYGLSQTVIGDIIRGKTWR